MQKTKNEKTAKLLNILLIIATYISFGLGNWYYQRGSVALLQNYFSNDIFVAIFAGLIPFVMLEISIKMFLTPMLRALSLDIKKISSHLRIFFIFANIVCFALSFIYFASRLLFVWGSILLNFVIYLIFFVFFLFYECKKMVNEKKGIFILQTGIVFILIFSVLTALGFVLTVI